MSAEDELLAAIESTELRSLQWGYVDGLLDEGDVDALAQRVVSDLSDPRDPVALVEELVSGRMLFEYPHDGTAGYRSRFAETVRLLAQMRQLMPSKPWATAPRLVSDYRVDSGSRFFPRRWIDPGSVVADLRQRGLLTALQGDVALSLLRVNGQPILLSDFQSRVLEWAQASAVDDSGCVITAGTGSGKTLAFYLPAVVQAAGHISARHWTQCLSVYPRRELLKDQFSEVFRLLWVAAPVLRAAGMRQLSAGALFGEAPFAATEVAVKDAGWAKAGHRGFVCPFLRCPACGSDLVWTIDSLASGAERLNCDSSSCHLSTTQDELPLTRMSITKAPPDFVFTTTETLHQRLSDPMYWGALGVPGRGGPAARWALFDEVHTYSGSPGAQVAYTIRRWRHAAGRQARLVGLSATLLEAPTFFAELTGLPLGAVREIGPLPNELEPFGAEYQLILRGDPASRTSLLSTSIQAAFLLPRMLDPIGGTSLSQGRFGRRAFVFTDDLDVTNRLFDDIRDAEAYDIFGQPDPARQPLAFLRSSGLPDAPARALIGQRWDACEAIGHVLDRRLGVSRTTSRDAGVASGTELVVATSSLEVGFNDPLVGGVVQHKGPLSMAAFLQRKGRAGRTTVMRPWMVTVLSDYGRDRTVFRNYERLFDPVLPPQRLPMRNRHVIAIQGAFALIDWLARSLPSDLRRWIWWPLNGPTDNDLRRRQQRWIVEKLRSVPTPGAPAMDELRRHLSDALGLDDAQLEALLWRQPRPLLTTLIPTVRRRVGTAWVGRDDDGGEVSDLYSDGPSPHPLPDFLPGSLFSDLNLPEVIVEIPPPTRNDTWSTDAMPIAQALDVLAPGRVTRRFAHARGKLNHWIPVPTDVTEYRMPIADFAEEAEPIGEVTSSAGDGSTVRCFRPWKVRLQQAPANIRETSNSTLQWQSVLSPGTSSVELPLPGRGPWPRLIQSAHVFLHSQHASVRVRRTAERAEAVIRLRGQEDDRRITVSFADRDGVSAALGFEHDVDGLRIVAALPTDETAVALAEDPTLRGPLVRHFFSDTVVSDETLRAVANGFQLDWLQQIYFAALMRESVARGVSPVAAANALHREGLLEPCRLVMADMLRFIAVDGGDDDGVDDAVPPADPSSDRLAAVLEELIQQPVVSERLTKSAEHAFKPPVDALTEWVRRRTASALGDVVAAACAAMAPGRSAAEELLVDVSVDDAGDGGEPIAVVWVTERAAGGTGTLDAVAGTWASDPMGVARALDAAAAPSDLEVAAMNMGRVLDLIVTNDQIGDLAKRVRGTSRHQERSAAQAELFSALARRGVAIDRTLSSSMNLRLLRRGVPADFDRLLADLHVYWRELEDRASVAIDVRTFAYLASSHTDLGARLMRLVSATTGHSPTQGEAVGVLVGVLWAPEWEVRARRERGSRYYNPGLVDLGLVRTLARATPQVIDYGAEDWRDRLLSVLSEAGEAILRATADQSPHVHRALTELLALPVDVGYLQFFPSIDAVTQTMDGLSVQLVIRELG